MTRIDVGLMEICSNCREHKKLQEQNKIKNTTRKTNHKKCKPKFNLRLKTQKHKVRTRYMLKNDSNITLF